MINLAEIKFQNPWMLVFALAIYGGFYVLFLRRNVVNYLDPIIPWTIVVSSYFMVLLLPLFGISGASTGIIRYGLISFFVGACLPSWLISSSRPKAIVVNCGEFITAVILVLMVVMVFDFVVNYVFGTIPIFDSRGTNARTEIGKNSRFLTWLKMAVFPMFPIVWASAKGRINILICRFIFCILFVSTILSGSKSGLMALFLTVSAYYFFCSIQGRRLPNKLKKKLAASLILILVLVPFYALFAKAAESIGGVVIVLFYRMVMGFDQLAYMQMLNVPPESVGINPLGMYFSPFLKVFGWRPTYSMAVEYLFAEYFGLMDAKSAMLPNNNLVMESIFSMGKCGAVVFPFSLAFAIFSVRRILLQKARWTSFHVMIASIFVCSPWQFLIEGQGSIVGFELAILIYVPILILTRILMIKGRGNGGFRVCPR